MNILFWVGVAWILFISLWWQVSMNSSTAALSFWPSRIVWSAMYRFQSSLLDIRSLIQVTQQWIRRFHCSGPAPSLLLMLMHWAISQMRSLTLLSFHCIVKSPFSCWIPMVSAAHWLTITPAFLAQRRSCWVGIWIVLVSVITDFGKQQASHYISGSQRWLKKEGWIANARYSEQMSGLMIMSSTVTRCGSRVSNVLEIVRKVGSQGEEMGGLGGVVLIRRHPLGCYSARNKCASHHLSALIHWLNSQIHHPDNQQHALQSYLTE